MVHDNVSNVLGSKLKMAPATDKACQERAGQSKTIIISSCTLSDDSKDKPLEMTRAGYTLDNLMAHFGPDLLPPVIVGAWSC